MASTLVSVRTCVNGAKLGMYLLDSGEHVWSWVSREHLDSVDIALGHRPGTLELVKYRDGRGDETTRVVTVLGFRTTRDGNLVWLCHCHIRDDTRTFRADRLRRVA